MSVPRNTLDWSQLHGRLPIPMTNDYLFRALMQRNNHVLKALTCSLLRLEEERVSQVVILNPIVLGEYIEDKDFILDIRILLDYTLFPDAPEFYATYRLMNEKTHKIYSDKLLLAVLDLKHIELATEEDRAYQTDHWAGLFRSTTWEELKKLAENHKALSEAAETVYALSEDEKIRMRCEAREDYYRRTGWKDDKIKELTATVERQTFTIEQQTSTIEQQAALIRQLQQKLASAGITADQEP